MNRNLHIMGTSAPAGKLKTRVGQIFLEHPKDENYTSVYEETFSKTGQSVELFAVIEITGTSVNGNKKLEYETLTRTIISAFKKTYVSAVTINEDTFERALSAVNASLGKLGQKTKISWFGQLHAVLAAFSGQELCLSISGNAIVYLDRGGTFTALSEGLSEESKAVKVFSNYSSGKLLKKDRVILSTKALFNYLSMDRLREILREESLDEVCHEIIGTLTDIKNVGFATFIFEIFSEAGSRAANQPVEIKGRTVAPTPVAATKSQAALGIILSALKVIGGMLLNVFRLLVALIYRLFRRKSGGPLPKKTMIAATGLVILLLAASIAFSIWKKSANQEKAAEKANLAKAEDFLNQAEAATIYQDENRVLSLVADAQKLLLEVKAKENAQKSAELTERAKNLKDKINKETVIENPTVLTNFPMVPTDLIGSPNGFLAFNRNTSVLAFYDFRSGETKPLLQTQNASALLAGGFVGGDYGYVFFQRNGKFTKLDVAANSLTEYASENPNLADADKAKIQGFVVLGSGNGSRLYLLDTNRNQIWRFRASDSGTLGPAEGWLKSDSNLADARDLAIDNNVYVLFENRIDRYFNGAKQNFSLSPVSPSIAGAQKVFTTPEQQTLYVLDPKNERILLYNKTGKLQKQLKSPKFRDASDFSVDEKSKIIYVVAGSELLQINF